MPRVEERWELIQIPGKKPLEAFYLVELGPEGGFNLTELFDPDSVCAARAVHDVSPHEMVSHASSCARARRVCFSADVDFFA